MKGTIGIVGITTGISIVIWILFYAVQMPLHYEDTLVVVAIVFLVTSATKWLLGRRNNKENEQ